MTEINIGSFGTMSIRGDAALEARLTALRRRVEGAAGRRPVGRQIAEALVSWQMAVREVLQAQHGVQDLAEYRSYAIDSIPLEYLIAAERLNAAGKAAAVAQGPVTTYQCRIRGCQHRVRTPGTLCPQCQHDAD